jgi:aspartate/methionine/tyrosine aminotransferase
MRIDRFQMEREQSLYENEVEYNLSESGVLPLSVNELLEGVEKPDRILDLGLKYAPSNGSQLLRERIATFYEGATADNILVANGSSEANFVSLWALLEKGDRVACMIPNYMQTWGLGRHWGSGSDAYRLVERRDAGRARWALDVASFERAVTRKTKLIVVTNPNNPTGAVLTEEEMDVIIRAARRVNAWILSDEVYRGAELSGGITPTFWGRYDKVLVTAGLSKAFGLPGLRIGWVVGPPATVQKIWSYEDYTTLTPGMLSDRLAGIAMEPSKREQILARTRSILNNNLRKLDEWIQGHGGLFSYIPPVAGAITLARYHLPIAPRTLFNRLRLEKSVLVTIGPHHGLGRYIRFGYGYDINRTLAGLARMDELLEELVKGQGPQPGRSIAARKTASTPRARAARGASSRASA